MAGNVYFKEDAQKIADVASKLQGQRSSFANSLSGMNSKANGLRSYWKSDKAESYYKKVSVQDTYGQELVQKLDEFIKKLQEASGIYTTADDTTKSESQGLPTDGVFR